MNSKNKKDKAYPDLQDLKKGWKMFWKADFDTKMCVLVFGLLFVGTPLGLMISALFIMDAEHGIFEKVAHWWHTNVLFECTIGLCIFLTV